MSSGVIAVSELNSGLATPSNYERFSAGAAPTGVVAMTVPRTVGCSNNSTLVSGREHATLVWLDAGVVVTSISFLSHTTAAVAPTNQWFTLRDIDRNLLRITNDNTTTAWGTFTERNLALTSPYTVPSSGFYYVGAMVAAATTPSLAVVSTVGHLITKPPFLSGYDGTNTGLTTPATAPATLAPLSHASVIPFAWVF